jgi:hypothetical protein
MAISRIRVVRGDGRAADSARVVLGFDAGHTVPAWTDHQGWATVDHVSTGAATVFVNGRPAGQVQAPGSTTVRLGPAR